MAGQGPRRRRGPPQRLRRVCRWDGREHGSRRPEELERALTDPTKRGEIIADFEESIEVAEWFDCPNLIVFVGSELENTRGDVRECP